MVKSRFGWLTFAFLILVLSLTAVVVFGLTQSGEIGRPGKDPEKETFQFAAVFIIVLILGYVFARYVTIITITPSQIIIKSLLKTRVIDRAAITSIDLFGKADSSSNATSAVRIQLSTGKDLVITGIYFSNMHEVRQGLNDHYKDKVKDYSVPRPPKSRVQWHLEKFTGNFHSSINGITFYILAAFSITLSLVLKEAAMIFASGIMLTVMFIVAAIQSYYFELDGQDFVVRNQLLPWINKKYALTDILIIEFDKPHKRSNAAVIYLQNFRRKEYSAGSLRSKRWTAMKDALQSAGVPVKSTLMF